jgi:hypothetical protein
MAQLQHNMWVTASRTAVLSIITGCGKWVERTIPADPLYQHLLLTAEKKFWRCVQTGENPNLFDVEPPRPRVEAVRVVDMSSSNSWAEFAGVFCRTRGAYLDQAIGHGVRARRSKSGAISFDGGWPCSALARPSERSPGRWQKPRSRLKTLRSR